MDQPEQKIKVFISYKRLDIDFVRKLIADLKKEGIEPWVDWEGIPTGEDWRNEIAEGLQSCHAFLFVISPEAVDSKETAIEVQMALENNKRILPIMYRDQEGIWGRMPSQIAKINAVNMRTDAEYAQNLPSLVKALNTDFDYLRRHTKLQLRAIEWDNSGRKNSFLFHGEALQSVEAWMLASVNKQPAPTDLQTEFVRASRKDETRRQRITLVSVSIGLAVALILAVVAIFQWIAAENARAEAVALLDRALVAEADAKDKQALAEANEALARANEAEANFQRDRAFDAEEDAKSQRDRALLAEEEATAQRDLAVQQQQLAFARRLGAEGLSALQSSEIERSLLLSISSLNTVSNPQADLALRTGLDLLPRSVAQLTIGAGRPAIFSLDGSLLYTGSDEGGVALWNTAKYLRPSFLDQSLQVSALALHPTQPWLAVGGRDGSLQLINAETAEILLTYPNPVPVTQIVFNPTGRSFVAAGSDNIARVWSTTAANQIFTVEHRGAVTRMAFSRNGSYLATAGADGKIFFYDTATRSVLITLGSPSAFNAMAFHPTNLVLLTGNADGLVQAWDMTNGREFRRLSHESAITDALISPDTRLYITASEDSTIRIWSTASGQILKTFSHNGPVRDLAIDASGRYLASASDDGTVRIWDLQRGLEIARSPILGREVFFAPTEPHVAVLSLDGQVKLFDYTGAQQAAQSFELSAAPSALSASAAASPLVAVATGSRVTLLQTGDTPERKAGVLSSFDAGAPLLDLALNADGSLLAVGDSQGRVCLWAIPTDTPIASLSYCVPLGAPVYDVDFSADGLWLAAGGAQPSVLTTASGTLLYSLPPLADGAITAVSLDQAGRRLAVATDADPSAAFWDLETGDLLFQTAAQFGLDSPADRVEYVPGLDWLVSSQGQNIFVWDAETGNLLQRFFSASPVRALAVFPPLDGAGSQDTGGQGIPQGAAPAAWLAIAGTDNTAKVWDLQSGSEVARIPHAGLVTSLVFDASGTQLLTASQDGRVQVNDLSNERLLTEACRRLTRNLSFNEWMLFLGAEIPYAGTCSNLPLGEGAHDALISQAIEQALAGDNAAVVQTLAILDDDPGVREQFLAALAAQVQTELVNGHLQDALLLSDYLLAEYGSAPELIPVTGGGAPGEPTQTPEQAALSGVCRAAAASEPLRALPVCDQAIALLPEDASLYAARGEARARSGDLDGALADFQAALALDPAAAPDVLSARQAAVAALEKGENPFPAP